MDIRAFICRVMLMNDEIAAFNALSSRSTSSSSSPSESTEDSETTRMMKILGSPDSVCTLNTAVKWFSDRHESKLTKLRPFDSKEKNVLLHQVLMRQESRSSYSGAFGNIVRVLYMETEYKQLTLEHLLKNKVFLSVWLFVIGASQITQKTKDALKMMLKDLKNPKVRNSRKLYQRLVVSPLDEATILRRMKRLVNHKDSNKVNRFSTTGRKWFEEWHEQNIEGLNVFRNKELNVHLRLILKLPSSRSSISEVTKNIVRILWKRKHYKFLSGSRILSDDIFLKIYRFVLFKQEKAFSRRGPSIKKILFDLRELCEVPPRH